MVFQREQEHPAQTFAEFTQRPLALATVWGGLSVCALAGFVFFKAENMTVGLSLFDMGAAGLVGAIAGLNKSVCRAFGIIAVSSAVGAGVGCGIGHIMDNPVKPDPLPQQQAPVVSLLLSQRIC